MATTANGVPVIVANDRTTKTMFILHGSITLTQNQSHTFSLILTSIKAARFWFSEISLIDLVGEAPADTNDLVAPPVAVFLWTVDGVTVWTQGARLFRLTNDLEEGFGTEVIRPPPIIMTQRDLLSVVIPALGSAAMPTFDFSINARLQVDRYS